MVKIVHSFGGKSIEKEAETDNFLLSNSIGGYASLPSKPLSKHQGIFFYDGLSHFKMIDSIVLKKDLRKVVNKFTRVEREFSDNVTNIISYPFGYNAFVFDLNKEEELGLVLDCRKADDLRQFGRYYDISEEQDKIIIQFTKKTDKREDASDGDEEFKLYVAIKADTGISSYTSVKNWFEQTYSYEENSLNPFSRYVYHALNIRCKRLLCAFSTTKAEAVHELDRFIAHFDKAVKQEDRVKILTKQFPRFWTSQYYFARLCAFNSLMNLHNNAAYDGLYAGFYWFRQYWSRDELISIKAFIDIGAYSFVKTVLFRWLEQIQPDGRLPNRYPASHLESADSVGWLFKRIEDYLDALEKSHCVHHFLTYDDFLLIKEKAEKAAYAIVEHHSDDALITNAGNETWMDTCVQAGIPRDGARLEIQALQLCIYRLMKRVCKATNDPVGQKLAETFELELKHETRSAFWNGIYLEDGSKDDTIRPNIFLVYYLYPELLSRTEWKKCFDFILPRLWLDWGGLSSIDKTHRLYQPKHIGEGKTSYHNGDSWFFLNNLAAYCLQKHASLRYRKYIQAIREASIKEILWMGIPGHHAEISSADRLSSYGCFAQAWSAAMLLELLG